MEIVFSLVLGAGVIWLVARLLKAIVFAMIGQNDDSK